MDLLSRLEFRFADRRGLLLALGPTNSLGHWPPIAAVNVSECSTALGNDDRSCGAFSDEESSDEEYAGGSAAQP